MNQQIGYWLFSFLVLFGLGIILFFISNFTQVSAPWQCDCALSSVRVCLHVRVCVHKQICTFGNSFDCVRIMVLWIAILFIYLLSFRSCCFLFLGKIRSWYWFSEYGLMIYSMSRNRYCERIGRQHKSNHGNVFLSPSFFPNSVLLSWNYDPWKKSGNSSRNIVSI